jgi:DNA-binding CsgD family transcriptional regulator
MHMSQSTAKAQVTRLDEKLGVSNRAQALMTAVHQGSSKASPHLHRRLWF